MSAYHKNALPVGYHVAEYAIERILGYGGFGVTYLAHDSSLGAKVAIKEYLPHDLAVRSDDTTKVVPNLDSRSAVTDYHWGLKRFLKEAQALAHFKHPNIVRVLRYLEANGTAYMVMEYEKGQSLGDYLKQHGNRMPEADILRIFLPILNGLEAVHGAGMLHFDIKPDNIYLREDGSPMLIDFGSARQAITSHSPAKRTVLTPGYAPIEQYPDKGKQGPWTDLYAIGASIYRCLSGKRPIGSLERYQSILKSKADPMTPAVKLGAGRYQPRLLQCVDWAMQSFPTDRPQSARELQEALMGKHTDKLKPAAFYQPRRKSNPRLRHALASTTRVAAKFAVVLTVVAVVAGTTAYFWPQITARYPTVSRHWNTFYDKYLEGLLKRFESGERLRSLIQSSGRDDYRGR